MKHKLHNQYNTHAITQKYKYANAEEKYSLVNYITDMKNIL